MKKDIIKRFFILAALVGTLTCLTSCKQSDKILVGITDASLNDRGELVLTFSDGSIKNVGAVSNEGTTINVNGDNGVISSAASDGLSSAVSITSHFKKTVNYSYGGFFPGYMPSTPQTSEYSSEGSGVIYKLNRADGSAFIITNYHVVYDKSSDAKDGISENIEIFLYGREDESLSVKAEYVGGSLYYDIAVLYVDKCPALVNSAYCEVEVADSDDVSVGTTAIAIGNPQGYGISASLGIVSVSSEYITMTAADNSTTVSFRVMRVDTAVNSGNSGGGLYNEFGKLIGIVNAKIVDSQVENIGYAIPSNVACAVADNIIDNCYGKESKTVMRPMIGVTLAVNDSYAVADDELGILKIKEEVSVKEVSSQSIAYKKLEAGDIFKSVTVNGKTTDITRRHHVIDTMLTVRAGDTVTFTVLRAGLEKEVSVTVSEKDITPY